ncbi:MAG: hypothetical protein ACRD8W_05180 [Nitrososphaeraceae archaeon]
MKFINQFTPSDINEWCEKGTVRITFSVVEPEGEEIMYQDEKTGKWYSEKQDRLIFGYGTTIRDWNDLFQTDDSQALFYDDKMRKLLR